MVDVDAPAARALRAIQKLDEVTVPASAEARAHLLEAEDALGELLGLACTGEREPSEVLAYDHSAETCPIHEWLVEADGRSLHAEEEPARPRNRLRFYIAWTENGVLIERLGHPFGSAVTANARLEEIVADPRSQVGAGWYLVVGPGSAVVRAVGVGSNAGRPLPEFTRVPS